MLSEICIFSEKRADTVGEMHISRSINLDEFSTVDAPQWLESTKRTCSSMTAACEWPWTPWKTMRMIFSRPVCCFVV
jgi:hypothetical protein